MVAYSFKARFVEAILDNTKTHTLRNPRKRHAREGEELQLYTGMRTRHCKLIATTTCNRFFGVYLKFSIYQSFALFDVVEREPGVFRRRGRLRAIGDPDAFARSDGFNDIDDMGRFWRDEHGVASWNGLLIGWAPLVLAR
jgi:hypothetical protein